MSRSAGRAQLPPGGREAAGAARRLAGRDGEPGRHGAAAVSARRGAAAQRAVAEAGGVERGEAPGPSHWPGEEVQGAGVVELEECVAQVGAHETHQGVSGGTNSGGTVQILARGGAAWEHLGVISSVCRCFAVSFLLGVLQD